METCFTVYMSNAHRSLTAAEQLEVVAHAVHVNDHGTWPSGRQADNAERAWAAGFVADVTAALLDRS